MPNLEARLIRGNSYTYGGRVFLADTWQPITTKEHEHLLASAVDSVTVSGGGQGAEAEFRQKFEFRETGLRVSDEDAPPKPPVKPRKKSTRKRRR